MLVALTQRATGQPKMQISVQHALNRLVPCLWFTLQPIALHLSAVQVVEMYEAQAIHNTNNKAGPTADDDY